MISENLFDVDRCELIVSQKIYYLKAKVLLVNSMNIDNFMPPHLPEYFSSISAISEAKLPYSDSAKY